MGGFLYSRIPRAKFRSIYLGLLTLEVRRLIADVCMLHKLLQKKVGMNAALFFDLLPSRTRGGGTKISFSRPKTSSRRHSFTVRAGLAYLNLSKNVELPQSLPSLKHLVLKTLSEQGKYSPL